MAIRVSEKIVEEGGVVVPTNLKKGVFTTSDFEVDQNTRSSLAIDEFHGTLISATTIHLIITKVRPETQLISLV